ncbi:unnamed protein product [Closterium sp. Naga37s-1]|nr:unnamed protein product [Closterium sp. Naga37s-1]
MQTATMLPREKGTEGCIDATAIAMPTGGEVGYAWWVGIVGDRQLNSRACERARCDSQADSTSVAERVSTAGAAADAGGDEEEEVGVEEGGVEEGGVEEEGEEEEGEEEEGEEEEGEEEEGEELVGEGEVSNSHEGMSG